MNFFIQRLKLIAAQNLKFNLILVSGAMPDLGRRVTFLRPSTQTFFQIVLSFRASNVETGPCPPNEDKKLNLRF